MEDFFFVVVVEITSYCVCLCNEREKRNTWYFFFNNASKNEKRNSFIEQNTKSLENNFLKLKSIFVWLFNSLSQFFALMRLLREKFSCKQLFHNYIIK